MPTQQVQNRAIADGAVTQPKVSPAGMLVPAGGTTGQVLAKASNTDYVTSWQTGSGGLTIPLGQNLTFSSDNTYDIGASSASRPRSLYLGTAEYIYNPNRTNDAANYERIGQYWNGNTFTIYPQAGGTGVGRDIQIYTWMFPTSGHFVCAYDTAYDIGGSASGRPRDINVGRSIYLGGNLSWPGSNGNRISGPFSAAVPSDNLLFQTRSGNSQSVVGVIPSGTSRDAAYRVYNNSAPDNAAFIQLVASTTDCGFTSDITGTGTLLPFRFGMGSTSVMRIETDAQRVVFPNTGTRIQSDFSNATAASRLFFQTSTTNGITSVGAMPNGSGTQGGFHAYGSSDANNAVVLALNASATQTWLNSTNIGTATVQPMLFMIGGVTRMSIATDGTVSVPGGFAANTIKTADIQANAATVNAGGAGTSDFSTSSTTYVDVPGMSATLTTVGGRVWVLTSGSVSLTSGSAVYMTISSDGVDGNVLQFISTGVAASTTHTFCVQQVFIPAAGSHTYKLRIRTNGNSCSINSSSIAVPAITATEFRR